MKVQEIRFNYPIPLGKITGKYWVFQDDWAMSVLVDGLWHNFFYKKGTTTDLGSVPTKAQGIVNNGSGDGIGLAIFLGHDNGYECHELSRSWYDDFLHSGLRCASKKVFDPWDGWLAWVSVRLGGFGPWKKASTSPGYYKHVPFEPKPVYGLSVQWSLKHGRKGQD